MLDRQAGYFRVGPFGLGVPRRAAYEPGTNTLVTTWHASSGWVVVRDALTMGPRTGEDTVTPHTRPPADDDGDHLLVRTIECIEGSVEMELVCEPVFDYGRTAAEWTLSRRPPHRRRRGRGRDDAPVHRHGDRDRGRPRARAPRAARGREAYCSLSWAEELASPASDEEARGADGRDHPLLAGRGWDGARLPDHQVPRADPALDPGDQGPDVHADRRDRRRGDDLAARDARRRAQLGLPLHLDARRDVHPAGAALAQPRLGGRGVHAVRGRPRAQPRRRDADHVRDRRPARPHRDDARRPLRLRRRAAGADRQRRVRPAPERRLRRRARLHPAADPPQPAAVAAAVADRREPGRVRDAGLARARPGHLGGARRAAPLRLVEAHVLGRDGPGGQDRRDPRRHGVEATLARGGRGDPRRHPRARRRRARRRCASTTRPTRWTPRTCWPPSSGSSRTTIRGCARPCWRSRTS